MDLKKINFSDKSELCQLMNHYGSDKGSGWHNYTLIYNELFKSMKNENLAIFEVGLGTNNTDVPSNMGPNGKPGASLRGWRDYFSNSLVYGADIDKRILFEEDRIKTFFTDQLNSTIIKEMWEKMPFDFDIIVDDGLHTYHANINFLENSFHKLKENGIYIIEDIIRKDIPIFDKYLNDNKYTYQILDIPNPHNAHDNVLAVIYKK
jgi:hypothetical protein